MRNEIDKLDSEYISCVKKNKEFPEKSRARRNRLMREIAIQFPDNEQLILPTPFGNIIQSVETYSRVVYGIEYVGGWSRMLTAIPAEYRNIIESSKNQIDFWINTFVLSVLFMIEVIVVWDFTRVNSMLVVVSFITIVASLLLVRAQTAAQNWGEYVSTSFDVYRNKLLELLAFPRPKSRQEEKQIWRSFSQSIIYRRPDRLPEIYFPDNNQTAKPKPKKKKNMNA
jgi:hypothetical protein